MTPGDSELGDRFLKVKSTSYSIWFLFLICGICCHVLGCASKNNPLISSSNLFLPIWKNTCCSAHQKGFKSILKLSSNPKKERISRRPRLKILGFKSWNNDLTMEKNKDQCEGCAAGFCRCQSNVHFVIVTYISHLLNPIEVFPVLLTCKLIKGFGSNIFKPPGLL
jgi:hypothetical protein